MKIETSPGDGIVSDRAHGELDCHTRLLGKHEGRKVEAGAARQALRQQLPAALHLRNHGQHGVKTTAKPPLK